MFEVGFSELLLIMGLALLVLGPEKLPKVVSELGRWVGRARAMARQFREQLEVEAAESARQKASPSPANPSAPVATPESAAPHEPLDPFDPPEDTRPAVGSGPEASMPPAPDPAAVATPVAEAPPVVDAASPAVAEPTAKSDEHRTP